MCLSQIVLGSISLMVPLEVQLSHHHHHRHHHHQLHSLLYSATLTGRIVM